jgi:hypothetical protein
MSARTIVSVLVYRPRRPEKPDASGSTTTFWWRSDSRSGSDNVAGTVAD